MSTIQHRLMVDRRRVLQGAVLAAAAVPLAACGGSGGSKDSATIKIVDYYADEPDNGIFQRTLEECAAKVGVTIERESLNGTGLIQKVLQMSSSKSLPDLLMLDNPDLQQIAATGALAPLSDFGIGADGFIEGFVSAGTYKGSLYGMGPCANTIGLYYDQDRLSAAGVAVPTTWDELKTAAKTLTSGDTYGIAFCAAASYEGAWQFLPFFWSNGAEETDIASPAAAGALQLWVDLVNEGSASSGVLNWGQGDVGEQFTSGKAAMVINGPWQTITFDESDVNWAVAEIPVPKAGDTLIAPLGGEVWTIPQTGDGDRQAKAAGLPQMASLVESVNNGRARTAQLGEAWPKTAEALYNAVQSALTGKASPQVALETAKADYLS